MNARRKAEGDNIKLTSWAFGGPPVSATSFSHSVGREVSGHGDSESEALDQLLEVKAFYDNPPTCVAHYADGTRCPNVQRGPESLCKPDNVCDVCWSFLNASGLITFQIAEPGTVTFIDAVDAMISTILANLENWRGLLDEVDNLDDKTKSQLLGDLRRVIAPFYPNKQWTSR